MDKEENIPQQEESPEASEGIVPECDSQGKKVILKSIGRLLVESSLRGDKPTPFPSMGALIDNTQTYWLENQDSLLSDCPN